jgi:hypothetical protein
MALNLNLKYGEPKKLNVYFCSPLAYILQKKSTLLSPSSVPFCLITVALVFLKGVLLFSSLLFDLCM